MYQDSVIEVNQVSKKFCKSLKYLMKYGILDITRGIFGKLDTKIIRKKEFWALKDISFEIKKGETWGIIGANGSGKSTLLKLINGIFMPDKGYLKIKGRVGALIEVGAGFHPMLTGRENIYVNGAILGMSRKKIKENFNKIVEFADIGNFLDTPVKNYSSGMYVRLGFSIAVHCLPDILLVDEILSIGDHKFQKKALHRMQKIINSGKVIIFVSHNLKLVSNFTKKAIYLRNGQLQAIGRTPQVINKYLSLEENNKT